MPKIVDHDERRELIAEAAWRVIERVGPDGASMRVIAREAGFTTGVLTHYFRDKRELMGFVFGLVVDRSTSRMAEAAQKSPLDALAELLPLDATRRLETTVWLSLMSASLHDPDLSRELKQRYQAVRTSIMPFLSVGDTDKAASEDREALADLLLAFLDGITLDALTDPERYPASRQLDLLRRALDRLGVAY